MKMKWVEAMWKQKVSSSSVNLVREPRPKPTGSHTEGLEEAKHLLVGIEIKPCNMTWSVSGGDKELSCEEKKSGRGDGRERREEGESVAGREERSRRMGARASERRRGEGAERED